MNLIWENKGSSGQSPEVLQELASLAYSRGRAAWYSPLLASRLGNEKVTFHFARSTSLIKPPKPEVLPRNMTIPNFFGIKINNIIKLLIGTMFFVNVADGIMAPVFAIFITQKIENADLTTLGYAVAVYWVVKSILQFPISRYLDRTKGENDDLFSMMIGIFVFAITSLLYIFAKTKFDLFLLQGLLAFGGALFIPPWYATFTRHVDQFEIGFEWSLNSGFLGVGVAGAGALSGILASRYGFNALFIISFVINAIAFLTAIFLYKYLVKLNHKERIFPEIIKK